MQTKYLRRYLALSFTAIAISACAETPSAYKAQTVPYDPAMRGEVEQQLAESAARSANALETLAMIQRTRTAPAAPSLDEASLPPELKRKATVEFTGPAVELARKLAASVGYGFNESGHPPASPGLITVNDHDVSVGKALEDVGLQSAKFATVIVDPNAKHVEFRNDNAEGGLPQSAKVPASAHHTVRRHGLHPRVSCTYCTPASN